MTDFDQKTAVGTIASSSDLFSTDGPLEMKAVVFDEATAGYTPAVGDILCYDTADTNKHQKWDDATATHVILGVIDKIEDDGSDKLISFAVRCTAHFAQLGYTTKPLSAANKLALENALRAKNITLAV
jgi:hypothetical protein